MMLPICLLTLTIASVWLAPINVSNQRQFSVWIPLALVAAASALYYQFLTPTGLLGLGLLWLFASQATSSRLAGWKKSVCMVLTIMLALALALHRWPGFNNPILISATRLSADAVPLTLYANIDKAGAGLILLALFCKRCQSWRELAHTSREIRWLALWTIAAAMGGACLLDLIRPELKLPAVTGLFLWINLFFTVIAEEAFFRGLIQGQLQRFMRNQAACVGISALLFGLAHLAGGWRYAAVVTLAGVGYAIAFQRTQKIESTIGLHLLLNTVHFIGFTYPMLRQ